jgi:hypothetical protein
MLHGVFWLLLCGYEFLLLYVVNRMLSKRDAMHVEWLFWLSVRGQSIFVKT